MILPSGRKSSVIKPSQHTRAALRDPQGGEIPMKLYAQLSNVFLVAGNRG